MKKLLCLIIALANWIWIKYKQMEEPLLWSQNWIFFLHPHRVVNEEEKREKRIGNLILYINLKIIFDFRTQKKCRRHSTKPFQLVCLAISSDFLNFRLPTPCEKIKKPNRKIRVGVRVAGRVGKLDLKNVWNVPFHITLTDFLYEIEKRKVFCFIRKMKQKRWLGGCVRSKYSQKGQKGCLVRRPVEKISNYP